MQECGATPRHDALLHGRHDPRGGPGVVELLQPRVATPNELFGRIGKMLPDRGWVRHIYL